MYVNNAPAGGTTALSTFASSHRDEIFDRLLRAGAVLFRGFEAPLENEGLGAFAREVSRTELFDYAGGASPRRSLADGVYTSTEYPQDLELLLHNELSYSAAFPRYLFFACIIAPQNGGETTLGSGRSILEKMPQAVVTELKSKGVRYDRHLAGKPGDGYSWQEVFSTYSRDEVIRSCKRNGTSATFLSDDNLRLSQHGPVTVDHPLTGEEVWFNQAAGFHASNIDPEVRRKMAQAGLRPRLHATFGDGSEIPDDLIEEISAVLQQAAIKHICQRGDLLMVDNILTAHGRMPFTGKRRIVLAMA